MTTSSSNNFSNNFFFQGIAASSSSVDVDYLTLVVQSVQQIAYLVHSGLQLNERQCQDIYSKLVKIVENIQKLVFHSRTSTIPFQGALKSLYKVLEKTKQLIGHCCNIDLCRTAVFQIRNEEAFRELLLEVGLCYNVIYELSKHFIQDWTRPLLQPEDLRESSLFLSACESDVLQDQQAMKRSLEQLASTLHDPNQFLAKYLLGNLQCLHEECNIGDIGLPDALLWMNEMEPQESWKLLRVLGSGSGACCVCCYNWFDIPCARKEFDRQVEDGIFRREAAILARLNHPNIVKFFCCSNGSGERQCFIAMELMEMSLDKLIENQGKVGQPFPICVVFDIIIQIARGMCYLHSQKIAHRDLKPLNVVVSKVLAMHLEDIYCVKLVDFGMSKIKVQVSKSNTISILGVGTTKYRAPEVFPQAQVVGGKKKVNWFKADVYSFAMTCAQLLSLKEPFCDVQRTKLYDELQRGQRPKLPQKCPKDLVALLKECWSTNPQGRPSFVDICSRLEKCKFQDLLKGSLISKFEGLQRPLGFEYIERVLTKQFIVLSQCASTIPYDLGDTKDIVLEEACDVNQFVEELHPSNIEYKIIEHKKKLNLWSHIKAKFTQVVSVDILRAFLWGRRRNLQHAFEETFKEFGVNPTIFTYNELRTATRHFHHERLVGHHGFGSIYKGVLPDHSLVAVKKQNNSFQDEGIKAYAQGFLFREVFCLSKLKHKNIVNLRGYCIHEENMLLVYDYVDIFDIDLILFDSRREMVSWRARLKIILGVAHGLYHMHVEANPRFIHRYINLHTILLDRNGDPVIADFGGALTFPIESDSHGSGEAGCSAPECRTTRRLDDKVDVYSFGILCMVIITARRAFNCISRPKDLWYLREWAWRLHQKDRLLELVDSTLKLSDEEVRDVHRVMKMSLLCTQQEPELRPSMAQVLSILQAG